jgi:hypothetical protein
MTFWNLTPVGDSIDLFFFCRMSFCLLDGSDIKAACSQALYYTLCLLIILVRVVKLLKSPKQMGFLILKKSKIAMTMLGTHFHAKQS